MAVTRYFIKILQVLLYTGLAHAATYYVASSISTPAGSDSNAGTLAAPWLTVDHALNHSAMTCGDTLMVKADGNLVAGDVNLPYYANCGSVTTIQGTGLANLQPSGYRIRPVVDSANLGKLSFTNNGIVTIASIRTWNSGNIYNGVSINTSTGQLTVAAGHGLLQGGLTNGMQVEFEPQSEGSSNGNGLWPTMNAPGGLSLLTKYYVVGCSASCGAVNSTFFLSLTPGGSSLAIPSCGLYCMVTVTGSDPTGGTSCSTPGYMQYNTSTGNIFWCRTQDSTWIQTGGGPNLGLNLGVTVGLDLSTSKFTIPTNWGPGTLTNGTALAFSAVGFQLVGTLPSPLQVDQIYYAVNVTGLVFQVALTPSGSPLTITTQGTGMLSVASVNFANQWAFRGLEMVVNPVGTNQPFTFWTFGDYATSKNGMPHHFEIDRCYAHDIPGENGIKVNVIDNAESVWIHDSWLANVWTNEGQAIEGTLSLGPTAIQNNFVEGMGENILWGGDWPSYLGANQNKVFLGNYNYKPPYWKYSSGTATPSGPCLWDNTDPNNVGGEWYLLTTGPTNYQCPSSGIWGSSTATPLPNFIANMTAKDMNEHKNGRFFAYIGNFYNGSFSNEGDSQSGEIFNNSMEYGSGPGAANDHITIMHNMAVNAYTFLQRESECGATASAMPCPVVAGQHVARNNLMVINPLACGPGFLTGFCLYNPEQTQAGAGPNITPQFVGDYWDHMTFWSQDSFPFRSGFLTPMYANSPNGSNPPFTPIPTTNMSFTNSIAPGDFLGQGATDGGSNSHPATLESYYANSVFGSLVLKGAGTNGYANPGATNTASNINISLSTNAAIGYVSATPGLNPLNYGLLSTSPFSAACGSGCAFKATDGTDVGIDPQVLAMYVIAAQNGVPLPSVTISPGSTNALVGFNAPTTAVCTPNLYPYPGPRNSNTAVGFAYQTITNGTWQQFAIGGLTASTTYALTVSCANGWIYVGTPGAGQLLITRAVGTTTLNWPLQFGTSTTVYTASNVAMTSGCSTVGTGTMVTLPVGANSLAYWNTTGCSTAAGAAANAP